jgi:Na+/glutamate symporter
MDLKINMGTIATSIIGAALIGGFTGFWTVSQNTLVNTKDVQTVKDDVEELKESQKEQQKLLIEILREVKK